MKEKQRECTRRGKRRGFLGKKEEKKKKAGRRGDNLDE